MENLNNLIWTDEDDNNGNGIQPHGTPMEEACLVAFCKTSTPGGGPGGIPGGIGTSGTSIACRGSSAQPLPACD